MYFASHRSGVREILYKAQLYNIAYVNAPQPVYYRILKKFEIIFLKSWKIRADFSTTLRSFLYNAYCEAKRPDLRSKTVAFRF